MKLEWRDVSLGGPPIHTSLTLAETNELQRLANGKEVLEVGSAYGYSAIAMALAGAYVLAIDPHQQLGSYDTMCANLTAYGVDDRVEIFRGDSRTWMARDVATRGYDLAWIDGDHSVEMVVHDVAGARKLLPATATLAVHDYDEDTCPGVREALDALLGPPPKLVDTLAIYGPGEW